jgi:hypothetical protein
MLERYYKNIVKIIRVLDIWEFNDKYFIYVPMGGDWADEYINEGYILYDQLLYLQALKEFSFIKEVLGKKHTKTDEEIRVFRKMIEINYFLQSKNLSSDMVYNEVIFKKGLEENVHKKDYMLPYFNPAGYGKKFDGFANSLAINCDVISNSFKKIIIRHVNNTFTKRKTGKLIPAFWPVIKRGSEWKMLKDNYSEEFRNRPYEYHNGGLWPFINGFYTAAVARINKKAAIEYLDALNLANYKSKKSEKEWGFYEFINSKNFRVGGAKYQAWSAAGGIMAYQSVFKKKRIFL